MTGILLLSLLIFPGDSPSVEDSLKDMLPLSLPDDEIRPLRSLVNEDLQTKLEERLNRSKHWARLLRKQKMAVGIVDLSDPHDVKFARINGSTMIYAASLPKLAILLASCQALEDGSLTETPEILYDMRIMISKSSNKAATRMYDLVGFSKIESVLTDPRYEFYDEERGGGLWVGKPYASRGERIPDPLKGISHGASVTQVCRFYYLLAMGRLINRSRSEQMLEILSDPEIHHKFVSMLEDKAPDAVLYRKSGSWRNFHSDSVLVWGPVWRRYILVALVEDSTGEQIMRDLIPAVEEVLKSRSKE